VVDIPRGQTFYQWSGTPQLAPGLYYWHVVSTLRSNGRAVGGQNGNGWSNVFQFTVPGAVGACGYSLADLDLFIRQHGGDSAALLQGFKLQDIQPDSLSDPDICALLASPQTRYVGVKVTKR
jgi:hypothetical protein